MRWALAAVAVAGLAGCATTAPYDYTAFKESRPASMLILPPLNNTNEVKATNGVLAQATQPLAEAGYYVLPVGLVDETFKQNGLTQAADIQEVSAQKLREIFGADAAVYLKVTQYGTTYKVISSDTTVAVEGRIVDLRNGRVLWEGKAQASSAEQSSSNQAGLIGALVEAVVKQIVHTVSDSSFQYAGMADARLLTPHKPNGLLYGPRSPNYGKD
ncbi:hypothetical protein CLD22_18145 [Rubrivivax gelatinosus]|nr:hypothetical protein [Rubrivivax gelatinosus]